MKSFQIDHAPQNDVIARNLATFNRLTDRSDPELMRHYNLAAKQAADRARESYPPEVSALCYSDYFDRQEPLVSDVALIRDSNRRVLRISIYKKV